MHSFMRNISIFILWFYFPFYSSLGHFCSPNFSFATLVLSFILLCLLGMHTITGISSHHSNHHPLHTQQPLTTSPTRIYATLSITIPYHFTSHNRRHRHCHNCHCHLHGHPHMSLPSAIIQHIQPAIATIIRFSDVSPWIHSSLIRPSTLGFNATTSIVISIVVVTVTHDGKRETNLSFSKSLHLISTIEFLFPNPHFFALTYTIAVHQHFTP